MFSQRLYVRTSENCSGPGNERETYVGVDAAVGPGADEGDELVASLVDHKAANLALVALLAEAPEKGTKKENTLVMSTPINNGAAFQLG